MGKARFSNHCVDFQSGARPGGVFIVVRLWRPESPRMGCNPPPAFRVTFVWNELLW